jgi:hypothetical protein
MLTRLTLIVVLFLCANSLVQVGLFWLIAESCTFTSIGLLWAGIVTIHMLWWTVVGYITGVKKK